MDTKSIAHVTAEVAAATAFLYWTNKKFTEQDTLIQEMRREIDSLKNEIKFMQNTRPSRKHTHRDRSDYTPPHRDTPVIYPKSPLPSALKNHKVQYRDKVCDASSLRSDADTPDSFDHSMDFSLISQNDTPLLNSTGDVGLETSTDVESSDVPEVVEPIGTDILDDLLKEELESMKRADAKKKVSYT